MFEDFLNLIYPNLCCACDRSLKNGEYLICTPCRVNLPTTDFINNKNNPIAKKFFGKVKLEHAFSYLHFVKKGKVQSLLHQLKYNNRPEIGFTLGSWFGIEIVKAEINDFDLIVPVPMHKKKILKRGYNQADPIAKGLSSSLNKEWKSDLLLKIENTISQTKKGRFERFKNADQVFCFNTSYNIRNKRILLIDDVVTTGSTLESCAKVLLEEGAIVSVATLAHAK